MSSKTAKKQSAAPKPLHIEIHGDSVDIVATFKTNESEAKRGKAGKDREDAWDALFNFVSGIAKGVTVATPGPAVAVDAESTINIASVVHVISMATPEDLEIIMAAIRARAVYDAKDEAERARTAAEPAPVSPPTS